MSRSLAAIIGVFLITWSCAFALRADAVESHEARGALDAVTVYRGQALVTRLVDVPGPAGLREVVVTDLPEQVVPGSIFAESADGLEVRSVRYRQQPMSQDVREEVRKLDERLQTLADKVAANDQFMALSNQHKEYLNKLEQFVAPTANVELTRGVLNADTLKALSEFLIAQRKEVIEKELALATEKRQLVQETELATRERAVLTADSARTLRQAVVLVNMNAAGGKLRLKYLVQGATWSPSYTARAAADRKLVRMEYNAQIQQMSGEDWTDVAMTLSTATPSLVARAPSLAALSISLAQPQQVAPEQQQAEAKADYSMAKRALNDRRKLAEVTRAQNFANDAAVQKSLEQLSAAGAPAIVGQYQLDADLNAIAAEDQVLDLLNRKDVAGPPRTEGEPNSEGVSVTYRLPQRTSLPSRADQQLVQIASLDMKGDFYKLALPVLTAYVYDEALVTNDGKQVLLAGPVNSYLADEFVGQAQIPTVAIGESFTVGFGIDSSLRSTRELVKKNESIQGGNRVVDLTYRLAIENFGAAPAKVRLMDRMPTTKGTEIKLTLVNPGQELSSDALYKQAQNGKGLLRWDVAVPAQAIGAQAFTIEYQLRLEYDRQMSIVGLPRSAQ